MRDCVLDCAVDNGAWAVKWIKRCIVLAAVQDVPESHWNIKVLMEITKINEVNIKLSQDLKLTNIVLGLQTHASKHPCPYGQCYRDGQSGIWTKGEERTIQSLSDNQKSWCQSKKPTRSSLKEYYNVEFQPLLQPMDPTTPVIHLIPLPPLHLVLLGKAVKIGNNSYILSPLIIIFIIFYKT